MSLNSSFTSETKDSIKIKHRGEGVRSKNTAKTIRIPSILKPIFKLQLILNELTDENVDEIAKRINIDPIFQYEFIKIISYESQIRIHKFDAIVSLLFKLRQKIPSLEQQILLDCQAYKIIRALYDRGMFSDKDIQPLAETRGGYFFPDLFDVKTTVPFFTYFGEFFLTMELNQKKKYDKQLVYDGYPKDSLQYYIKVDDIVGFRKAFLRDKEKYLQQKRKQDILQMKFPVSPFEWFNTERNVQPESYSSRKTLIQMAAYYGSLKCFKFLYENGAEINNDVNYDAIAGCNEDILEICDEKNPSTMTQEEINDCAIKYHIWYLIDLRSTPSKRYEDLMRLSLATYDYRTYIYMFFKFRRDPEDIHFASTYGFLAICMLLIENGTDVNYPDFEGKTPLICATIGSQWSVCKYLLSIGADYKAKSKKGWAAIHYAAQKGDVNVLQIFYQNDKNVINLMTKYGDTPLEIAIENKRDEFSKLIREMQK